jgi:hypothetical protein
VCGGEVAYRPGQYESEQQREEESGEEYDGQLRTLGPQAWNGRMQNFVPWQVLQQACDS